MRFLNTILDIVFPAKCVLCGKTGIDLCRRCLQNVPEAQRESARWIFPLYDYRDKTIKKSLWLLKYRGRKRLANIFAENIYEKIVEELSDLSIMENFHDPILIPIPLSRKRYRERGFNQAQLICEEIVKINNLRSASAKEAADKHGVNIKLENNILIKPRDTLHQAHIKNRNARLKNMIGTFAIKDEARRKDLLKGKNIILIDDILTTGATLNEARKVLRQAGARKIIAFTVAH
ncbi:MAG: phosphoribosyltransferase family protein [Minisyncoccia bacterium]